jgi:hypothetical protein
MEFAEQTPSSKPPSAVLSRLQASGYYTPLLNNPVNYPIAYIFSFCPLLAVIFSVFSLFWLKSRNDPAFKYICP